MKKIIQKMKGLLFAICVLLSLVFVGKVEVSADTLTMTIERFTTGGGFIMEPTVVEFTPGESYADVLQRVLTQKGYTYSYNTTDKGFYLQGIDNVDVGISNMPSCIKDILTDRYTAITGNSSHPGGLYEFSYTSGSGWMYFVNNQYVNVGMSKRNPAQGDVVRFMFTLYLGADITGQLRDYDTNVVTKTYYTTADKTELVRLMGAMNQDKAHWSGIYGFSNAYTEAVAVMSQMDASANDVNQAISWLKEIQAETSQAPASITFPNSSVSIKVGGNPVSLNVKVLPSYDSRLVTWSSSNTSVATVKDGMVTPVSSGIVTITATTSNGLSATCKVTVTNDAIPTPTVTSSAPTGVTVNPSTLNLATGGKSSSLTYTVSPYGAKVNNVKWESGNTSVATVDSNGKVTSVGTGVTDICCIINDTVSGTCRVTVYPVAESISLSKTSISMNTGEAGIKLTYSITPANAQTQVIWSSDNVAVARVMNDGTVSAVGVGEANIRVTTDNGKGATCHVKVTASQKETFISGMPKMTAKVISDNAVTISWKSYTDAERYVVSRRSVGSGPLVEIASVTGLSYTDNTAKSGMTYYYSVKAASKKWGKEVFSSYDTNVQVKIPTPAVIVGKTTISKVVSSSYNKLKITWKKVSDAEGYIIYRSTSSNGTYKKVKKITNGSAVSYTDTNLVTGQAYYYKVCAYCINGNKFVYASRSAAKGGKAMLAQPTVKTTAGAKKATVKWSKISGASGYEIYRSASPNKGFVKVKNIAKGSTVSYIQSKLTKGKTYYYRVRAYRTVNDRKVYGKFSTAKAVKVK